MATAAGRRAGRRRRGQRRARVRRLAHRRELPGAPKLLITPIFPDFYRFFPIFPWTSGRALWIPGVQTLKMGEKWGKMGKKWVKNEITGVQKTVLMHASAHLAQPRRRLRQRRLRLQHAPTAPPEGQVHRGAARGARARRRVRARRQPGAGAAGSVEVRAEVGDERHALGLGCAACLAHHEEVVAALGERGRVDAVDLRASRVSRELAGRKQQGQKQGRTIS